MLVHVLLLTLLMLSVPYVAKPSVVGHAGHLGRRRCVPSGDEHDQEVDKPHRVGRGLAGHEDLVRRGQADGRSEGSAGEFGGLRVHACVQGM